MNEFKKKDKQTNNKSNRTTMRPLGKYLFYWNIYTCLEYNSFSDGFG